MPEAGRAPTWSWVSIDAKIWFEAPYGDVVHAFCTVLDVICDPLSQDPTGQVKFGHLKISGYLIKVEMTRRANPGMESPWVMNVDGLRRPPLYSDTIPSTHSAVRFRIPPWYSYTFGKKRASSTVFGISPAVRLLTVPATTSKPESFEPDYDFFRSGEFGMEAPNEVYCLMWFCIVRIYMNLPVPLAFGMTPSRHWRCMNLHLCLTYTQLILHPFVTKLCRWCDSALLGFT
jgi:hypothetical protein